MAEQEDTIMEERQELMLSRNHHHLTQQHHQPKPRLARFLKPSSLTSSIPDFSYNPPQICCSNVSFNFNGWRLPPKDWKPWLHRMHSLHQSTWKKAGIHHAILNSSYDIIKNDDSIIGLAENWCPNTNSFVFVWGEATITLEDMVVLGGYSALGESVFNETTPPESQTVLTKLDEARLELSRGKSNKASQTGWLKKFKDSGSEVEHEAFLILWLSRFVFPSTYTTIPKNVFPIAIRLARGIRIALAPAVLATLYRDLSLLKAKFDDSMNLNDDEEEVSVTVWAPLQLVQVWIWERLPKLTQSACNAGDGCKPRFSRWDKKRLHIYKAGSLSDCALEKFSWRPYAATGIDDLFSNKVYQEKGRWVVIGDDGLDEELESWVRCLRASELVGISGSCIEQYLPHRVAMQFGMDQDVPGDVPRQNSSPETAWRFYTRPIRDVRVYLPSKFYEPYVTSRYMEWWSKSVGVGIQARSSPPMGGDDDGTFEISVKDESRTQGSKESVDDTETADVGYPGITDEVIAMALELDARITKLFCTSQS